MARRSALGRIVSAVLVCSLTLAVAVPAGAANELRPATSYRTGDRPLSVVRADIDLDTDADILVAEVFGGTVSIMRNNGNGVFTRGPSYAVSGQPVWVAAGKVDGDSYPDLVIADEKDGRINVRLNNRRGGFGAPAYYSVGKPSTVALRDVTGDKKNDLLVTSQQSNSVVVFTGNGAGKFTNRRDYRVQLTPRSLAFGDFNRDGRTDIVTANYYSDTVSVLLRTSTGFAPALNIDTNVRPFCVDTGDVNNDGTSDIVVTDRVSDSVWTMLNNGSAQFAYAPWLSVDHDPTHGSLVDLNRDGRLDLVSASYTDNTVWTFLGTGTGAFNAGSRYSVGSSRVDLQACKLEYSIVSPK